MLSSHQDTKWTISIDSVMSATIAKPFEVNLDMYR